LRHELLLSEISRTSVRPLKKTVGMALKSLLLRKACWSAAVLRKDGSALERRFP
jgi:hypothetical protein